MFSTVDWIVLFFYLIISSVLGLILAGKSKDAGEFLFGGRRMPWVAVGISMIATSVSATTFLANPADAFEKNMVMILLGMGSLLAIPVIWFVFLPRFAAAGVSSAYELLEIRFNRSVRLVASAFYMAHLLLRTGISIFVPSLILAQISGLSQEASIILIGCIAIGYTCMGGIRAVIWTDVIQFIVLFGGGLFVVFYIAHELGSLSTAWDIASAGGHTTMICLDMDPSQSRTLFSLGVIYMVFEVAIRGCDQQFVQRYISVGSARKANYSSILSVVMGIVVSFLFLTVGAFLWSYYTKMGMDVLPHSEAGIDVNKVFPYFITHNLPAGSAGILVAAIFAAAMSSLDSAISALANTTVIDFCKGSDSSSVKTVQLWTLVWGCCGIAAAFICLYDGSNLLHMAYGYLSLFIGPLLGFFLTAFFYPRAQPHSVIIGALLGMITLWGYPLLAQKTTWLISFAWPWRPLIALAGMAMGVVISELCTALLRQR